MPPTASLTLGRMATEDGSRVESNSVGVGVEDGVREQDRLMPIANVIRIMRRVLPSHAKISDDAKETIQECVSELISFIASEANERCQKEQRKTINAEDVLWAMNKLGFDSYMDPLTMYLQRCRDIEGDHGSMNSSSSFHHPHYAYMASLPRPYTHFM